jgi:hypothetical protein
MATVNAFMQRLRLREMTRRREKYSPYWAAAEYFMRTRASAGDDFDLWHLLFVNVTFLDLCPADFSLQIHSDVPFIFYTLLTFA